MNEQDLEAERERQRTLLSAIFAPQADSAACGDVRQSGARREAGLAAYRGNGLAHASNALRVQFPTVVAMLGADSFRSLCVGYWRICPPRRGDLAWVGEDLPAYLATLDDLTQWPWLADSARLDWAIWRLTGAAAPRITHADLQRLAAEDPARLQLHLSACVDRVPSDWPIVTILHAHRQSDPDWAAVRQTVASGTSEIAWVWRPHGDPVADVQIEALDATTERWVDALEAGASLDAALDAAGSSFDFARWMSRALEQGWLDGVTLAP